MRHWLQFWQLRTWIHDNLCYLTIKSDSGQHLQFLRCLIFCILYLYCIFWTYLYCICICIVQKMTVNRRVYLLGARFDNHMLVYGWLHVWVDPVNEVGSLCVHSWVASLSAPEQLSVISFFCVFCVIDFYPICIKHSIYLSYCKCYKFDNHYDKKKR